MYNVEKKSENHVKKMVVVTLDTSDTINLNFLDVIPTFARSGLDKSIVNVDLEKRKFIPTPSFKNNNNDSSNNPKNGRIANDDSNHNNTNENTTEFHSPTPNSDSLAPASPVEFTPKFHVYNNLDPDLNLEEEEDQVKDESFAEQKEEVEETLDKPRLDLKQLKGQPVNAKPNCQVVECKRIKMTNKMVELLHKNTVNLADILDTKDSVDNASCKIASKKDFEEDDADNDDEDDDNSRAGCGPEEDDADNENENENNNDIDFWTIPTDLAHKIRELNLEDGMKTKTALNKIAEVLRDLQQSWKQDFPIDDDEQNQNSDAYLPQKEYKPPNQNKNYKEPLGDHNSIIRLQDNSNKYNINVLTICPKKVDPFLCESQDCSVLQIPEHNIRTMKKQEPNTRVKATGQGQGQGQAEPEETETEQSLILEAPSFYMKESSFDLKPEDNINSNDRETIQGQGQVPHANLSAQKRAQILDWVSPKYYELGTVAAETEQVGGGNHDHSLTPFSASTRTPGGAPEPPPPTQTTKSRRSSRGHGQNQDQSENEDGCSEVQTPTVEDSASNNSKGQEGDEVKDKVKGHEETEGQDFENHHHEDDDDEDHDINNNPVEKLKSVESKNRDFENEGQSSNQEDLSMDKLIESLISMSMDLAEKQEDRDCVQSEINKSSRENLPQIHVQIELSPIDSEISETTIYPPASPPTPRNLETPSLCVDPNPNNDNTVPVSSNQLYPQLDLPNFSSSKDLEDCTYSCCSITPAVNSIASMSDVQSGDDIKTRCSTASTITEFEYSDYGTQADGEISLLRNLQQNLFSMDIQPTQTQATTTNQVNDEKFLEFLAQFNKPQQQQQQCQNCGEYKNLYQNNVQNQAQNENENNPSPNFKLENNDIKPFSPSPNPMAAILENLTFSNLQTLKPSESKDSIPLLGQVEAPPGTKSVPSDPSVTPTESVLNLVKNCVNANSPIKNGGKKVKPKTSKKKIGQKPSKNKEVNSNNANKEPLKSRTANNNNSNNIRVKKSLTANKTEEIHLASSSNINNSVSAKSCSSKFSSKNNIWNNISRTLNNNYQNNINNPNSILTSNCCTTSNANLSSSSKAHHPVVREPALTSSCKMIPSPMDRLRDTLPRTVCGKYSFTTQEAQNAIAEYVKAELQASLNFHQVDQGQQQQQQQKQPAGPPLLSSMDIWKSSSSSQVNNHDKKQNNSTKLAQNSAPISNNLTSLTSHNHHHNHQLGTSVSHPTSNTVVTNSILKERANHNHNYHLDTTNSQGQSNYKSNSRPRAPSSSSRIMIINGANSNNNNANTVPKKKSVSVVKNKKSNTKVITNLKKTKKNP